MKRIIVSLLIALPISGVVTALLLFASAFFEMSCHNCDTGFIISCHTCDPVLSVFFPYGMIMMDITKGSDITWGTGFDMPKLLAGITIAAMLLQFPLYAIVIAIANGWRRGLLVSLLVLIVHSIAAVCSALTMYRWW